MLVLLAWLDRGVDWEDRGGPAPLLRAAGRPGADDYYTGRGEVPGEWQGAGARASASAGLVSGGQFQSAGRRAWIRAIRRCGCGGRFVIRRSRRLI